MLFAQPCCQRCGPPWPRGRSRGLSTARLSGKRRCLCCRGRISDNTKATGTALVRESASRTTSGEGSAVRGIRLHDARVPQLGCDQRYATYCTAHINVNSNPAGVGSASALSVPAPATTLLTEGRRRVTILGRQAGRQAGRAGLLLGLHFTRGAANGFCHARRAARF